MEILQVQAKLTEPLMQSFLTGCSTPNDNEGAFVAGKGKHCTSAMCLHSGCASLGLGKERGLRGSRGRIGGVFLSCGAGKGMACTRLPLSVSNPFCKSGRGWVGYSQPGHRTGANNWRWSLNYGGGELSGLSCVKGQTQHASCPHRTKGRRQPLRQLRNLQFSLEHHPHLEKIHATRLTRSTVSLAIAERKQQRIGVVHRLERVGLLAWLA